MNFCEEDFQVGGVLLCLVKCVVMVNGHVEEAIKCIKIDDDGTDSCTVAYTSESLLDCPRCRAI